MKDIFKDDLIYIKLFFVAMFFGSTFIAGRILAETLPPFTSSFYRFLVASLFLLLFVLKTHKRLPQIDSRQILILILLSLSGIVGYNFFFFSRLKFITASRASIIISLNPALITLCFALFFKEKITKFKSIGILLSLGGALTVISQGNFRIIFQNKIGWREILILECVACWVTFTVLGKKVMMELPSIIVITYSCLLATFFLFFPAILEGNLPNFRHYNMEVWLSIFALGFFWNGIELYLVLRGSR